MIFAAASARSPFVIFPAVSASSPSCLQSPRPRLSVSGTRCTFVRWCLSRVCWLTARLRVGCSLLLLSSLFRRLLAACWLLVCLGSVGVVVAPVLTTRFLASRRLPSLIICSRSSVLGRVALMCKYTDYNGCCGQGQHGRRVGDGGSPHQGRWRFQIHSTENRRSHCFHEA